MEASQRRRGVLWVVTFASISSQFVAGLMWSGLPHFAASASGQYELYGLLFLISSLAGIVTPLIGGFIPARFNNVTIAVASSVGTALCYLWIASLDFSTETVTISIVLLLGSIMALLSAPAFSDLLGQVQKAAYDGDLEAGAGHYQTFVMIAKLAGFSLGPVAFASFGSALLYVIALGYLLEAGLLSTIRSFEDSSGKGGRESTPLFQSLGVVFSKKLELSIALLNGILSFPMITLALLVLAARLEADTLVVTVFWIATSATSVAVNSLISRGAIRRIGRQLSITIASACVLIAVTATLLAPSSTLLIAGFCFFTLGNPVMGTVSQNLFFHAVDSTERRRLFGFVQMTMAIGVSIGIGVIAGANAAASESGNLPFLAIIGTLLLMRLVLMKRAVRGYEEKQATSEGISR